MATDEQNGNSIAITFTHPRDSNTRKIRCSPAVTAKQAIEQLVKLSFIEQPNKTTAYSVVLPREKDRLIPPNAALESAGVRDGDTLAVTESNSLASGAVSCRA